MKKQQKFIGFFLFAGSSLFYQVKTVLPLSAMLEKAYFYVISDFSEK